MKILVIIGMAILSLQAKASALDINYDSPAVTLQAEVLENGEARITAYPTDYSGDIKLEKFQTFNLGDQLEPACQKIKDRIKLLRSDILSESMKKSWREAMLLPNIVILRVNLQPWIQWSALEVKIREALPESVSFVQLMNPLHIKKLNLQIQAQDTALSMQLESFPELEQRLADLLSPGLLGDGMSPIVVSSVPLVCDIVQGKIQLGFSLQGYSETSDGVTPYDAVIPLQWVK